jgi:GNAT superfamily N-acetyltransferase
LEGVKPFHALDTARNDLSWRITREQPSDKRLQALHAMHYRVGEAKATSLVLCAWLGSELAGALWVAYPVLNSTWRRGVWTELPTQPAEHAQWLNANVRTIRRVIVDPKLRACGVATALVRAYLQQPQTKYTEALASMGRANPFFVRAGMREVHAPRSKRDEALLKALEVCGVESWRFAEVLSARSLLHKHPSLRRAVQAWARRGKATRTIAKQSADEVHLAMLACMHAAAPALVYVAMREDGDVRVSSTHE